MSTTADLQRASIEQAEQDTRRLRLDNNVAFEQRMRRMLAETELAQKQTIEAGMAAKWTPIQIVLTAVISTTAIVATTAVVGTLLYLRLTGALPFDGGS